MRNPFSKTYEPNELRMFDFLQGIKFFELLKQQELARFLPTMHERKYVRDEVVFFSKDPSQALYLIRKGQVDLTIDLSENFETIMQLKRGDAFGENSLLENSKRTYTALVSSDEAELLVIPQFALLEIFDNNPKTAVHKFLKIHDEFEVDKLIQNKLKISLAPDGYLKRIK